VEGQTGKVRAGRSQSVVNFSPLYRFAALAFYIVYAPLVLLFNWIVFGLRIEGRDNLERGSGRGSILVSNHSLYLDPGIVGHTVFPRRCCYSAMHGHFRNPVAGAILRLMGAFPVPGGSGMRKAERTVREALDRGRYVHFFPEGEMKHLNQAIAPFKSGAFYLALRLGVPIVPVTLVHRPRILFGTRISRYFIRVKSIVGEPVMPPAEGEGQGSEAAARFAAEIHRKMVETIASESRKR
jgi:1-acyl-sn-glycerol-3-phosphate acyltransferase